jgi:type VI secretion system protein ImpK
MFPDHVRFAALLGVGVCVLLGVSHLLWSVATADVQRSVMQFQAIALADAPAAPASSTSVSGAVVRVPVKPRAQPSTTDAPALPQSNALAAIPAVPAVDTNTVVLRTAADGGGNRP